MVSHHRRDRLSSEDAPAIELAAIEQHLGESQIIGDRGQQSAAAREHAAGIGELLGEQRSERLQLPIGAMHEDARDVTRHRGRRMKRGCRHPERTKERAVEIRVECHA